MTRAQSSRVPRRAFVVATLVLGLVAGLLGDIRVAQSAPASTPAAKLPPLPSEPLAEMTYPPAPRGADGPTPGGVVAPADKVGTRTEIEARRSARSNVFKLPNGMRQAEIHTRPINYLNSDGQWKRIRNELVPGDGAGTLTNTANSWSVTFGTTSQGVSIVTPTSSVSFAPLDGAEVSPSVGSDGTSAVYKDVWRNADLVYRVYSDRVEEDIVLKAAPDRTDFKFRASRETQNEGFRSSMRSVLEPEPDGSLRFEKPVVFDKDGREVSKAKPSLAGDAASATVSVDPAWVTELPSSAYPVTIDPTTTVGASMVTGYLSTGATAIDPLIGNSRAGGDTYWRSVVLFDYAWLSAERARITSSSVDFTLFGGTANQYATTISGATSWSYNGVGTQLASGLVGTTGALSSPQLTAQLDAWTSSGATGGALMFQGAETPGLYTYKDVEPVLNLTYTLPPDEAAVARPSDGATVVSTTPTLAVTPASDPEGDAVSYRFQVFTDPSGTGTPVFDNGGYLAERSITLNAPLLDGVTYAWRATTFDGVASTLGAAHSFRVDRRLGADSTSATQAAGPFTVNLGNGNVMTSVGTPSVATVAGSAGVSLTYNSLDTSADAGTGVPFNWTISAGTGEVGYAWATVQANGNVLLTDANGVLHEYKANGPNGYTPPKGGLGVLTKNTVDNSLTLIDEDGTVYAFGVNGLLQSVRGATDDLKPAALDYVYSTGSLVRLVQVKDPARGNAAVINVTYQGLGTCPTKPDATFSDPLNGRLCQVTLIDGRTTNFFYVNNYLARIVQVGGVAGDDVTDFGYNSMGHIISARTPLQNDWLAAGNATDTEIQWDVAYETPSSLTEKAVSVTAPRPVANVTTRPKQTFAYKSGNDTGGFYAYATSFAGGVDVAAGDVNADGKADIVTGPGAGGTGEVKAWQKGSWAQVGATITPYPGFTGPINVAAGDVNGDGTAEIITGAGTGGGPNVKVFRASDGVQLGSFYAYESTFTGGVDVAAGDTDGNGTTEIVTTPGPGRNADVKVFNTTGTQTLGTMTMWAPWTGGLRVTTLDTDYDKKVEIAVGAMPEANGSPRLTVMRGDSTVLRDSYVFDAAFNGGIDVGGDGRTDGIAISPLTKDALLTNADDGSYVRAPYGAFSGGTRVALGDLDGLGVANAITGAGPLAGGAPHVRTFSPKGTVDVNVDGLSPAVGYARRVVVDGSLRQVEDRDGLGKTSRTRWDPVLDRVMSSTDPAGRRATSVYDSHGWATESNGPAPGDYFNDNGTVKTAFTAVAPRQTTSYDQSIQGLAATYWNNKDLTGAPTSRATGVGDATNRLVKDWTTTAPSGVGPDNWSARFTGEIDLPLVGTYTFQTLTDDGVRVFIDDAQIINDWTSHAATWNSGTFNNPAAGRKRIRVEYFDGTGGASMQLDYTPPGGTQAPVPGTALFPAYGLATASTTADGPGTNTPSMTTTTSYSGGGMQPEYGLPTSTTTNGESTVTAYEAAGAGFFRRTSRTLPAGNGWVYSYWDDNVSTTLVNERNADNPCTAGTVEAIDQAGMLKSRTGPDPDGAGAQKAKVDRYVYDAAGRILASATNDWGVTPAASDWSCVTYDTRGRVAQATSPAFGGETARTITYTYPAPGADPRASSFTDGTAGTVPVATTIDLLGRAVEYTDAWNKTTTYTYDQAGRLTDTNGPQGLVHTDYDDAGKPTAQKLDGALLATPAYDAAGEFVSATYGTNPTTLTQERDVIGRTNKMTWKQGVNTVASDSVTYSQSGRVSDQVINGTDAYGAGPNFTYDNSGRLVTAYVPLRKTTYSYAASGGCGPLVTAGKNTNRTATTWTATDAAGTVTGATTSSSFCYDNADRLTFSSDAGQWGNAAYDTHGNTTQLGTQSMAYDGADRHVATTNGDTTVVYERDAENRIIKRSSSTMPYRGVAQAATTGAGATTLTINKPAGAMVGDTVVAAISVSGGSGAADPTSATWTLKGSAVNGTAVRTAVFTHTVAANDPTSWTWNLGATARQASGMIAAYGNVASATLSTAQINASSTQHATPSISVADRGSRILSLAGLQAISTFTPPVGSYERADLASSGTSNNISTTLTDVGQASKLASGVKTITSSVAGLSVGYTIRLAPTPSTVDVTKYSFTGPGDSPSVTLGDAGNVVERSVGLVGGATITKRATLDTWSYPNIHGDIMLTTDGAGGNNAYFGNDAFGNPIAANAWGQPYGTTPENSNGDLDYGWLGAQKRGYEHAPGISIIEMGARQYSPVLGRFLEVDPVEGGSANDYDYADADPVNNFDLAGTYCVTGKNKNGSCRSISRGARRNAKAVVRAPVNVAGRVVGRAQGRSHQCGSGQKMRCVNNARFVPGGADAWTLGNTVYCRRSCKGLVAHEAVHVGQFSQGGLGFVPLYGWEAIFGGTKCGNKYERSAYNSAGPHSC